MNNIIVFTLTGCKYCIELKEMLNQEMIEYIDINVDDNEEIWTQVVNQTGHNSLPTVYIEFKGKEEGPVFVPERDFNSNEEIIEIIKNYITE